MLTMASIPPRCWAPGAPSWRTSSWLFSLKVRHRYCSQQLRCVQARSSIQEEFSPTKQRPNFETKEFNLPKQPKEIDPEKSTTIDAAPDSRRPTSWPQSFQEAQIQLQGQGPEAFLIYGGAAALVALLSSALLSSLDSFPLVPETLQLIGVTCSLFVAIQGRRPAGSSFQASSPVRSVIAFMDQDRLLQQTSLVLPQDLDAGTVATMQRLARERDNAVNQVEEMKRQTSAYAQVVKEKEALETVALQLAEERETAMAEVGALKASIESMSERMRGIEGMLDREIGGLKAQNEALETVALQLAQERDVAVRETVTVRGRFEAEKQALEEVAGELARERDGALVELQELVNVVAKMRAAPASA